MQVTETFKLWTEEEYDYPAKGGFIPNVTAYIHEDDKIRPAMVIVPGGGYYLVAATEGEIVAEAFYNMGYQAFVVTYTTNVSFLEPLRARALKDLSRAVVMVRSNAESYKIDVDRLTVCGFSAGGHLVGSLAVDFDNIELEEKGQYAGINNRPNAVILSYPVITSGEYAHEGSFKALLGDDPSQDELDRVSLEKRVRKDMPPVFIWQCLDDDVVPVENSFLFVSACRKKDVRCEFHTFMSGGHGVSLANKEWRENGWRRGQYVLEQLFNTIEYAIDHKDEDLGFGDLSSVNSLEEYRKMKRQESENEDYGEGPREYVGMWTELANGWLDKIFDVVM